MNIIFPILTALLLLLYSAAAPSYCRSFAYREPRRHDRRPLASLACRFYRTPGRFLASIRLGSLIFSFLCLWTTASYVMEFALVPDRALNIALGCLSALFFTLLISGAAQAVALRAGYDLTLSVLAVPLQAVSIVMQPLSDLLLFLTRLLMRLRRHSLSDSRLAELLGYSTDAPSPLSNPATVIKQAPIKESERQILKNALKFSDIRLRDCLVPRIEIVAVETGDPVSKLIDLFVRSGKTKIIVYEGDLDHVIGYIHATEMFNLKGQADWSRSIQTIPIVPESMTAQHCMQILLRQKKSLALIVDEFGGTAGIVSLEDLVEEIFGEIEDEHDTVTLTAQKTDDGEYLLSARLEISRINEMFSLHLPEGDEYQTLGGLILWHLQDFPKPGQTVDIDSYRLKILKTQTSKIDLVRLKPLPKKLPALTGKVHRIF